MTSPTDMTDRLRPGRPFRLASRWIAAVLAMSTIASAAVAEAVTDQPADASALSVTRTFSPNARTISTSEGTIYSSCNFWTNAPQQCIKASNVGYGPTTVFHINICLSGAVSTSDCSKQPRVTGPLSAKMLAGIDERLSAFEGTGVRLAVRFTYNFGPIGPGAMDAPIKVISTHIDQLAPILLRHRDLIVALDAGFIGTWGEWHDSTNGNDTAAAQKALLDKERAYFRGVFPVLVRYPGDLIQYSGGAAQSDLGLHDDAYASNVFDGGTWNPCVGNAGYCLSGYTLAELESYAAKVSTATLFTGEFGPIAPALQPCAALDQYSHTYHLQFTSVATSTLAFLKTEGCDTSFYNKVGVRIELHKATATVDRDPARGLDLALTLSNAGYGRMIRPRPAKVVFLSHGKPVAETPIPLADLDLRQLQPAVKPAWRTFNIHLHAPAEVRLDGPSAIALVFPDPAPSLESKPAYALPLNSIDDHTKSPVFDPATGYNVIISDVGAGGL